MTDADGVRSAGQPTDEELAAAVAAVRVLLRRRRGQGKEMGSRWMRAGRVESVTPSPEPAWWSTAQGPR